jgi:hypothetical protein
MKPARRYLLALPAQREDDEFFDLAENRASST